MGDDWTINENGPPKGDHYEWRSPNNEDQHSEQTTDPGDLMIKPEDLSLVPTNSPTRSGVQWGQDGWDYTTTPDSDWYIQG
jgi:hypothetical protein